MTVEVALASSDHQPWIRAKIQPYLAELSKFVSIEKNFEGQYDYPYLDHYWREPDRHPFIIYLNNEAVGFLLVREDMDPTDGTSLTEISELYILPERTPNLVIWEDRSSPVPWKKTKHFFYCTACN